MHASMIVANLERWWVVGSFQTN